MINVFWGGMSMKNKFYIVIFLLLFLPLLFTGCGEDGSKQQENNFILENGVLTISGSGTLTNFWGDCSTSVTEVKFDKKSSFSSIAKSTFKNYKLLSRIEIPASITEIQKDVFYGCSKLNSVDYFGSPKEWSQIKFENLYSTPASYTSNVYFGGKLLTNISFDNFVEEIKPYAFYNFSSLETVSINATSILQYAFYGCLNLKTLTLNNFYKSYNNAFYGCETLKDVYFCGDIYNWLHIDFSNLYSNPLIYAQNLYFNNDLVETVELKNSRIPQYAFSGYKNLKEVSIDGNIDSIGDYAFYNCQNASVTIGDNNKIDNYHQHCFDNCNSLSIDKFSDTLKYVGDYAFAGCYDSEKIEISNTTYYIGNSSFSGAKNVVECVLPFVGTRMDSELDSSLQFGCIFGNKAYEHCKKVNQSYGYNYSNEYYIPNSIRIVKITNDIDVIAYGAFQGCSMIDTIYIPSSIKEIRMSAFYGCDIRNCYFSGNADEWASIGFTSNIFGKNECSTTYLYFQNEKVENIKFTNISKINQYAFYGIKGLKTIEFSDNLIEIGKGAFSLCDEIEILNFNNCSSLKIIDSYCFYRCYNLKEVNIAYCSNLEMLGNYAFSNCLNLGNVFLYDDSIKILSNTFYACPNYNIIYTI